MGEIIVTLTGRGYVNFEKIRKEIPYGTIVESGDKKYRLDCLLVDISTPIEEHENVGESQWPNMWPKDVLFNKSWTVRYKRRE